MAHLVDIAKETRIILKVGGVLLAVFFLVFFSFKGYGLIKQAFFPPPPLLPEQGFGPLPQITFPQSNQITPIEYTINTVDGNLPGDIPDRLNVYGMSTPSANLLALQQVRQSVAGLGFLNPEVKLNDTVYQWSNEKGESLQYDILNDNFKYGSNFLSIPIFNTSPLNEPNSIVNAVFQFLGQLQTDVSELNQENVSIKYLKREGDTLIESDKLSDAQFAQVDLQQQPLGKIKINGQDKNLDIYYPYANKSLMSFLVAPTENNNLSVVQGEFIHIPVNRDNFSDYPIKTPQQAFEDLKNGDAYIVLNNSSSSQIDITEVLIGYFIGNPSGVDELAESQKYLLPIYIFKGNNFMAYVSAVDPGSISN